MRAKRLTRSEKMFLAKGRDPKCFLRFRKAADYYEFLEVSLGKILTLGK